MDFEDQVHCHAWIHCLITAKDENPVIQPYFREEVNQIVEDTFIKMGSSVRIINCSSTHLNCLFNLNPEKSVQEIVNQVQKVSADFINAKLETQGQPIWEEDFSCLSVDSTNIEEVFNFIRDQDIRNLTAPDKSEFIQLLELHKVSSE
jgi:REP element-mobilizing transposase RayT